MRAEIIPDSLDGLEHVEALLRARGVNPEAQHVPRKNKRLFRRNQFRGAIMAALRDGPKSGAEVARQVAASTNKLSYGEACSRVNIALHQMRAKGLVVAEKNDQGRYVWRLAPGPE